MHCCRYTITVALHESSSPLPVQEESLQRPLSHSFNKGSDRGSSCLFPLHNVSKAISAQNTDQELSPCFSRVSNHRRFDPHFSRRTSSGRVRSNCSCGYLVYISKKNLDGQFFRVKLIVKWASCKSCRCPGRVKQTNKHQRRLSWYTIKVIFTVTAFRGLQSLVLSETPFSLVKLNQMNVMLSGTS